MKIVKLFLIALNLFVLQSCLPSVELNQRAIVEAIGIDKVGNEFVVSVEYYDPDSNNPEKSQTSFIKESGKSVPLAISKINSKINKELYFGHNNFIVVGLEAAKKDIIPILEHFDMDSQTKADICVFVTETAEKMIDVEQEKTSASPLTILEIIEGSVKMGNVCEYKLFKAIDGNNGEFSSFLLPFAKITESSFFELDGSLLFKDGILIETISQEITRGLCWYCGSISGLVLDSNGFEVEISSSESQTKVNLIENSPVFEINISLKLDSPIKDSPSFDKVNVIKSVSETVKRETEESISFIFKELGCDVFDLSKRLKTNFPESYDKIILSNAIFKVNCSCYFS